MTDPIEEQHLIDRIEDAETDLKRYRKQIWCIGIGEITGALFLLFGVMLGVWGTWHHRDTGLQAAVIDAAGVIILGLTNIIFSIIKQNFRGSPQRDLTLARRKYRDHIAKNAR